MASPIVRHSVLTQQKLGPELQLTACTQLVNGKHCPFSSTVPAGHPQAPWVHTPAAHTVPHAPQLFGSLLVKLQLPAQQLPPSPHAVLSGTATHAPVAGLQVLQSPQDTPAHGSGVFVGVSVGVEVLVGVAATHEPPMQAPPALHTFPHAPQLFVSVAKSVHTDGWDPPKQQLESPAGQTASLGLATC